MWSITISRRTWSITIRRPGGRGETGRRVNACSSTAVAIAGRSSISSKRSRTELSVISHTGGLGHLLIIARGLPAACRQSSYTSGSGVLHAGFVMRAETPRSHLTGQRSQCLSSDASQSSAPPSASPTSQTCCTGRRERESANAAMTRFPPGDVDMNIPGRNCSNTSTSLSAQATSPFKETGIRSWPSPRAGGRSWKKEKECCSGGQGRGRSSWKSLIHPPLALLQTGPSASSRQDLPYGRSPAPGTSPRRWWVRTLRS